LRNDAEYRARFLGWVGAAAQEPPDALAPAWRAVLRGWRLRIKPERAAKASAEPEE
jgi:hypothetical protein